MDKVLPKSDEDSGRSTRFRIISNHARSHNQTVVKGSIFVTREIMKISTKYLYTNYLYENHIIVT